MSNKQKKKKPIILPSIRKNKITGIKNGNK